MPKRILSGQVISAKMDKTLKVRVERRLKHSLYKKYISRHKNYFVHDPDNSGKDGDEVSFIEHPPISKNKKWLLVATSQGSTKNKESTKNTESTEKAKKDLTEDKDLKEKESK